MSAIRHGFFLKKTLCPWPPCRPLRRLHRQSAEAICRRLHRRPCGRRVQCRGRLRRRVAARWRRRLTRGVRVLPRESCVVFVPDSTPVRCVSVARRRAHTKADHRKWENAGSRSPSKKLTGITLDISGCIHDGAAYACGTHERETWVKIPTQRVLNE